MVGALAAVVDHRGSPHAVSPRPTPALPISKSDSRGRPSRRRPPRGASDVPPTRLVAGGKPSQFVLFPFVGVGGSPSGDMFLDAAEVADSRFTALKTGLYFLTDDNAYHCQGPCHARVMAASGCSADEVREEIRHLNKTWLSVHEMDMCYVGHFCAGSETKGARGNIDDWKSNDGPRSAPEALAFGPEEVTGGRSAWRDDSTSSCWPARRVE